MNCLIKRHAFSLTKYTGSLPNVSRIVTLIGVYLDKYVKASVGCLLSGLNMASKSYTIK